LAQEPGIRVHVFEEGYIRPNWITLERGGVNGESRLPRDPAWFVRVNENLPDYGGGRPVRTSLAVRAAHDMAYHIANLADPVLFPGYRSHRPYHPALEYAGWARRFSALPFRRRGDARRFLDLVEGRAPFFLLPLQLFGDFQITRHSPFSSMADALAEVLQSFASSAPAETRLLIKNHPLDTGLFDYRKRLAELERELDLRGRVFFVEAGDLPAMIAAAQGVVVVNSTVGMTALQMGRPVKALGTAIYDLPGLTYQGTLQDFWQGPAPPGREIFEAFRNVVIHTTQVNGDFYTREGIAMAVEGCLPRLLAERSPLEELLG
jgi:capsular polysaccharide export protein